MPWLQSGLTLEVAGTLGIAVLLAIVVPLLGYPLLRRLLNGYDAAALAATYGSVSAVTFITTIQFLENQQIAYGGHMAAAMALMESPAIIMAVLLANRLRQQAGQTEGGTRRRRWAKSCTNPSPTARNCCWAPC